MTNNNLIIACAGSGKTTTLVKRAKAIVDQNVLITTYTDANRDEIENKFIEEYGSVPRNITIQTWVSFLLEHGVRPFQAHVNKELFNINIGFFLIEGISGRKGEDGKTYQYNEEQDFFKHYFTGKNGRNVQIYSDKLSKFVCRANEKSSGEVITRMAKIYPHIFIDEIQDESGWDLDVIKLLLKSSSEIVMVGDPRQGTITTSHAQKGKKFRKSKIIDFFGQKAIAKLLSPSNVSLTTNYRCSTEICNLSNALFPDLPESKSGRLETTPEDGVFVVRNIDLERFLMKRPNCMQLRRNIDTQVLETLSVMTFKKSKGLAFDHVLIYPTKPFLTWFKDWDSNLADTSRSELYVALTRARISVGIVCEYDDNDEFPGIKKFSSIN